MKAIKKLQMQRNKPLSDRAEALALKQQIRHSNSQVKLAQSKKTSVADWTYQTQPQGSSQPNIPQLDLKSINIVPNSNSRNYNKS